jgi:hypothetical protein
MIYVRCEALPNQAIVDRDRCGGAWVNCWVNTEDPTQGEALARQWILEQGWTVVTVEEVRVIPEAEQQEARQRERVREALAHGGSLVFHKWAADGEPPVA